MMLMLYANYIVGYDRRRLGLHSAPLDTRRGLRQQHNRVLGISHLTIHLVFINAYMVYFHMPCFASADLFVAV